MNWGKRNVEEGREGGREEEIGEGGGGEGREERGRRNLSLEILT